MTVLRKAPRIIAINVAVIAVLFAVLEGTASILFVGNEILRTPGVPEQHHVEHDEMLGWVNRPNVRIPDMYGPGVYLQTNAQRFRNTHDVTPGVAPGKTRIVCSGDSFTLGFGVDNDQAWCQRLAALDSTLETVNMGQGGYGVDQAYLWYMRDGQPLEHQVLLFAFLTDDFDRMRSDRFMGYGKPLLAVRNDSLVIVNRPVPRTSWPSHWRALHGETVGRLNTVRLFRRLFRLDRAVIDTARVSREDEGLRDVVVRIFDDLQRATGTKGRRFVLVYFPGSWDYKGNAETDTWRAFVRDVAARKQITLLDLVDEIQRVAPTEVDRLFAPNEHFSVAGNDWAANVIHRHLTAILDSIRPGASTATRRSR